MGFVTQLIMKRLILLMFPVVAIAVAAPDASEHKSREESIGQLWQESLTAETGGDAKIPLEKLGAFAKSGGDPYMVNLRAAWLNYSAQKYEEAIRYYVAAAKLQASALNPRLGLLNCAQAQSNVAAAATAAEAVIKIEPTNYRALMAVAWGAFQAKDYRRAGTAYLRLLTLYPEDLDAMSGAAWSAFYTGQKREARDGFRRLMSLSPDYTYARQGIAATLN